ncbi:purine nucleoside permease [Aspergillus heterothallicus]
MRILKSSLAALLALPQSNGAPTPSTRNLSQPHTTISPKVFIISMFTPETKIWHNIPDFNLLAHNISLPGLSPQYPFIHCTPDYTICQITTGEGEINAAVTISALLFSSSSSSSSTTTNKPMHFNLTKTYFLIAGIAGISPHHGTTGSVTFPRFAVQPALAYEIDSRELPPSYSTGYIPQGGTEPGSFPRTVYGTEVFALNGDLVRLAARWAREEEEEEIAGAGLDGGDDEVVRAYRAKYGTEDGRYAAATRAPGIEECDTATGDVYFAGRILAEAVENTTRALTAGRGVYCTSQQEDNATLEALLRGAKSGLVDFRRVVIMRAGSDFDRPYPGQTALEGLMAAADQGGFGIAVRNLYVVGRVVIRELLAGWEEGFKDGIKGDGGYVGDVWGTLNGGVAPEFGVGMEGGEQGIEAKRG